MHSCVACTLWSLVSALENCLHDIAIWMHTNYFALSFIKTLAWLPRGGHSGCLYQHAHKHMFPAQASLQCVVARAQELLDANDSEAIGT